MDLDRHNVRILGQVVVGQLNVWVDAHAATPGEYLIVVSKSERVVVAKAKVLDVLRSHR